MSGRQHDRGKGRAPEQELIPEIPTPSIQPAGNAAALDEAQGDEGTLEGLGLGEHALGEGGVGGAGEGGGAGDGDGDGDDLPPTLARAAQTVTGGALAAALGATASPAGAMLSDEALRSLWLTLGDDELSEEQDGEEREEALPDEAAVTLEDAVDQAAEDGAESAESEAQAAGQATEDGPQQSEGGDGPSDVAVEVKKEEQADDGAGEQGAAEGEQGEAAVDAGGGDGGDGGDGDGGAAGAPQAGGGGGGGSGGGGSGGGGGPTRQAPHSPRARPQVGVSPVDVDFGPFSEEQEGAIWSSTGNTPDTHRSEARAALGAMRTRAEVLQARSAATASGLADALTASIAGFHGSVDGAVVGARARIASAYGTARGTVEGARAAAQGDVAAAHEQANADLDDTYETQFQLLQGTSQEARALLERLETDWTAPFTELEQSQAALFAESATAAAGQVRTNKDAIIERWPAPTGVARGTAAIEQAQTEKIRMHAGVLVDRAATRIESQGPTTARAAIETLGHPAIIQSFLAPLQSHVAAIETQGLQTLDTGVAMGRVQIQEGSVEASERIDADAEAATAQLTSDEAEACGEVDQAGEQLKADVETETESSGARFTETAATQATAYDSFVAQVGESVEDIPFLTADDAREFGRDQTQAIDQMGDQHRAELESLRDSTFLHLQDYVLQGVERIDGMGTTSAEQAAATGREKANALRGVAERFGESMAQVSEEVARSMESYTQPVEPQIQEWLGEVQGQLEARRVASEAALQEHLAVYRGQLSEEVSTIADNIDPRPAAAGIPAAMRQICSEVYSAISGLGTNRGQLLGALRRIESGVQGRAVQEQWMLDYPRSSSISSEIDDEWGLGSSEKQACWAYLGGRRAAGARLELTNCINWYGDDEERIEAVLRSLDDDTRAEMMALPEWADTRAELEANLGGTDWDVTAALIAGNTSRADAYRLRDSIDSARRWGDNDALHTALAGMDQERRAEIAREFAHIQSGGENDAATLDVEQDAAYDQLSEYATREVVGGTGQTLMRIGVGAAGVAATVGSLGNPAVAAGAAYGYGAASDRIDNMGQMTGANRDLADALIRSGRDSDEATISRFEVERTRDGGPNQANLETALMVSPEERESRRQRLHEAGSDEERARIQAEIDAEQSARVSRIDTLWQEQYGGEGVPESMNSAIESMFANQGSSWLADSNHAELEVRLNQQMLADGTNSPEVVALATQIAVDGAGTDEERLQRMWTGLTPAEAEQASTLWQGEFGGEGETLEDRLFGGTLSEMSGDDAREQQRRMMGDEQYMNAEQRLALANHELEWSIGDRTGALGSLMMTGTAEAENLRHHRDALQNLVNRVGAENGGSVFDASGNFVGTPEDYAEYERLCGAIGVNAGHYRSRTDSMAGYVVHTITIVAAVVAAVLTGGAATPAVAAAIAAATGATSIAANVAIRGDRYGWEEAAVDIGVTAVDAATAGAGRYLAPSGSSIARQMGGALVTGSVGSGARTAMQDATWRNGLGAGFGQVVYSGVQGGATSAVSAGVSGRLGDAIGDSSATRRVTGNVVGSALGGMASSGTSTAMDAATGRYTGDWDDAVHAALRSGAQEGGTAFLTSVATETSRARGWDYLHEDRIAERRNARNQAADQAGEAPTDAQIEAAAAETADVQAAIERAESADAAASDALAANDAEQASQVAALDERIAETVSQNEQGEPQTAFPQGEAQQQLDAIEGQVRQVDQAQVEAVQGALSDVATTGDQAADQIRAELDRAASAEAAQGAGAAPPAQGGSPTEANLAAAGGEALGLSPAETAIAQGLNADQVREWQQRVQAGEGDQATVLRRVAAGTPPDQATASVVVQETVAVGGPQADDGPAPSTGPAPEPAMVGVEPALSTGPSAEPPMVGGVAPAQAPPAPGPQGVHDATPLPDGPIDLTQYRADDATREAFREGFDPARYANYADAAEDAQFRRPEYANIPTDELIALRGYTEASPDDYRGLNSALRSQDPQALREQAAYIQSASSALNQLPPFEGTVYRGTDLPEHIQANYQPGAVVTERAFTSTSASETVAQSPTFDGNTQFVIQSRTGRDVTAISAVGSEQEVLFAPGTRFQVLDVQTDSRGRRVVYMEEVG